MCLGWGLRGYIGGGPLGAMIPGAMVVMALCLLLRRSEPNSSAANGLAAAFGAVGVGFGGQMTYGQTIGLTVLPETAAWGLLGLTLKGAIWGFLGGAVVATGLIAERFSRRTLIAASTALTAACWVGWKLINEPKLIYFSDPLNKPRPEIWAGLLLAAVAWLVVLRRERVVWNFAWVAAIGGGIGFGFGGWINALGRTSGWPTPVDWWKVMEFTFGFLFGAALGYASRRWRHALRDFELPPDSDGRWWVLLLPAVPLAVAAEEGLSFRFTFMVIGAILLVLCHALPRLAWQVAITTTSIAFSVDFLQSRPGWNPAFLWGLVAAVAIAVFLLVDRNRARLAWLLLFLVWLAVADSHVKSWLPPYVWNPPRSYAHAHVEAAFTCMATIITWAVMRLQRLTPAASASQQ